MRALGLRIGLLERAFERHKVVEIGVDLIDRLAARFVKRYASDASGCVHVGVPVTAKADGARFWFSCGVFRAQRVWRAYKQRAQEKPGGDSLQILAKLLHFALRIKSGRTSTTQSADESDKLMAVFGLGRQSPQGILCGHLAESAGPGDDPSRGFNSSVSSAPCHGGKLSSVERSPCKSCSLPASWCQPSRQCSRSHSHSRSAEH